MRLFFAVWPPPDLAEALAALARPELENLRWVDQWHVTLRFLEDADPGAAREVLEKIELPTRPVVAEVGPFATVTGRAVLSLPVRGLDGLAAAVQAATEAMAGAGAREREFRGHLTLARARGRRSRVARVQGLGLEAGWEVRELTLVVSRLSSGGPSYQVLASRALPA